METILQVIQRFSVCQGHFGSQSPGEAMQDTHQDFQDMPSRGWLIQHI